ncbi:MAG: histidinol-phosphatase [Prevotellaceae bacterium]|nr:histidinol-phosphatase [Prevotellaceae bacterium]
MNGNLTNYHSHCLYCDGRADMEPFVRFALNAGFTAYGFSSHAPLPFPTAWTMEWDRMHDYLAEIERLKRKYAGRIELYTGLEIDYLNESSNPASAMFKALPLDFRIGSVHLLYNAQSEVVDIDLPVWKFRQMVVREYHGDVDLVVRLYYNRLMRMVQLGGFEVLGHADKLHYNANCYRPGLIVEPWYDGLVRRCFEEIARRGYIVEVNTKAYVDQGVFFPDARYFPFLHDLGIRVQVNSDAHYPHLINSGRPQALRALRAAGYKHVMELHGGDWLEMPIRL